VSWTYEPLKCCKLVCKSMYSLSKRGLAVVALGIRVVCIVVPSNWLAKVKRFPASSLLLPNIISVFYSQIASSTCSSCYSSPCMPSLPHRCCHCHDLSLIVNSLICACTHSHLACFISGIFSSPSHNLAPIYRHSYLTLLAFDFLLHSP